MVAKAVEGNNDEEMGDGESSKGSSWQTLLVGTEEILEHMVSSLFGMALCAALQACAAKLGRLETPSAGGARELKRARRQKKTDG